MTTMTKPIKRKVGRPRGMSVSRWDQFIDALAASMERQVVPVKQNEIDTSARKGLMIRANQRGVAIRTFLDGGKLYAQAT